tara:strand:- start:62 stop:580 length:519 start_codon:yes stop_codon:yes gene_type:complete
MAGKTQLNSEKVLKTFEAIFGRSKSKKSDAPGHIEAELSLDHERSPKFYLRLQEKGKRGLFGKPKLLDVEPWMSFNFTKKYIEENRDIFDAIKNEFTVFRQRPGPAELPDPVDSPIAYVDNAEDMEDADREYWVLNSAMAFDSNTKSVSDKDFANFWRERAHRFVEILSGRI